MRKRWLIPIALLALAGGAGWWFRGALGTWIHSNLGGVESVLLKRPKPDPKTYATLTNDLERRRKDLAARHAKAKTAGERAAIEADARALLETSLPAMMRCWLGTPWDFNGTAKGPGDGKIACGYFVATVLKDAGFQVDRYQLAQQASENILRSFIPRESCALSVGKEFKSFAEEVGKREPGVYVIGLDTHVAFIVVGDGGFRFIHSSGSKPWCVVDESPDQAGVLQRSNWRMLGNLTADAAVLRHWLKADKIVVRGT
ncbi:MAG: hypothetical protein ABIS50_12640 [Luteolibacter sp.]|uniref:hypothetical protein n=1 Tax=Luteolibacter sp. TaxID=1962973 RepID=UPI003266589C